MSHNIKSSDFSLMRVFGRYAARDADVRAYNDAATYILIGTDEERTLLTMEFHEGVRNSAENQGVVDECMRRLEETVKIMEGQK